jgi:hypothetical protein
MTNKEHIQAYITLIEDLKAMGVEGEHLPAAANGVLKGMILCELKRIADALQSMDKNGVIVDV